MTCERRCGWPRALTRVRAQVLGRLARALRLRDRLEEARSLAAELQVLAAAAGGRGIPDRGEDLPSPVEYGADGDIIPDLADAAEAARRIGSGPLELLARCEITNTLEARGEHENAIRAGRDGLARARQLGLARYVTAPMAGNLAESLISAGRWDEALELADEAASLGPAPYERECLLVCRGQIAAARGDLQTAARMVRELRALPAAEAETHRALPLARLDIQVRLAEGDLDGALAVAGSVPGRAGQRPAVPVAGTRGRDAGLRRHGGYRPGGRGGQGRRTAGCAGPGGSGHRAARPGGAGARGGIHRRGVPRRGAR